MATQIKLGQLPIPDSVNLRANNTWNYNPDQMALFAKANEWRKQHGIRPSNRDRVRVHVLAIDEQKDFCFPDGTLYVAGRSGTGALDDNIRVAEFIYKNLALITNITTTMDTHFAYQIFFAPFWQDAAGEPLTPFRNITTDDIRSGRAKPNPALASWLTSNNYGWLMEQVMFYCEQLESAGKYQLYLWPPHCILGSGGHPLVGIFHEARLFHNFVRGVQSSSEIKGMNPLTEHYSVFRPEVPLRFDGGAHDQTNTRALETMAKADVIVIPGQADSHCVAYTIDDLLDWLGKRPGGDQLVQKVYILRDCTSSVVVRDPNGTILADFTPEAEARHQKFAAAGAHIVDSTIPITEWPDVPF